MPDQWDRFADGASRSLSQLGFSDNVRLYAPTESYTPGEGYDHSYPPQGRPTHVVTGSVGAPSPQQRSDAGGTTREADLRVHVPADLGLDLSAGGDPGDAPTRLRADGIPGVYEVQTIAPQTDGLLRLSCAEVGDGDGTGGR